MRSPEIEVRARAIELVGVAGAGKSTLARALVQHCVDVCVADTLHTRQPAHWRYVAHGLPRVLPLLGRAARRGAVPSWDEVKYVIYASEWSRFLRTRPAAPTGFLILDQGPIFALARLYWGGLPAAAGGRFQRWVVRMIQHWSDELEMIAVLTAPDQVLVERINQREQRHDAKGIPAGDALELIAEHREAYARVLDVVESVGRLPVIRFDTSVRAPERMAAELDAILGARSVQPIEQREMARARLGVAAESGRA